MNDLTHWMSKIGFTLVQASQPLNDLGKAVAELSEVLANLGAPDRTSYFDATVVDSRKNS